MPLNIRIPRYISSHSPYINRSFQHRIVGTELTLANGKVIRPIHGVMKRASQPVTSWPYKAIDLITEVFKPQILARRNHAVLQNTDYVGEAKARLSSSAELALQSLESKGYWVGKLADLSVDKACLGHFNKVLNTHYDKMRTFVDQTSYSNAALQQSEYDKRDNWSLYNFGLEEELLNLATAYIKLPVAYIGAQLRFRVDDPLSPQDGMPHRDGEEGAFEGERPRMLKMFYLPKGLTEDQAPITLTKPNQVKLYGEQGTLVIVDTAMHEHCLIPQIVNSELDRFVNILAYSSVNPIAPHTCLAPVPSNQALQEMDQVFQWSDMQKRAAYWRGQMPYGKSFMPIRYRIPFTRFIVPWVQSV